MMTIGILMTRALLVCVGVAAAILLADTFLLSSTGEREPQAVASRRAPEAPALRKPTPRPRTITLRADARGHYWLDGRINNAPVRFIVDTGATGIAIGPKLARAAGFRLVSSDYTGRSRTANGIARRAPITLRRLTVGPVRLRNMPAHVTEAPMNGVALLGMSFLSRLKSYEVSNGRMTLRW